MCLIITGKAQQLRETLLTTKGLLEDIYRSNPDGIGVMFPSRRGLRIHKKLPKTVDQARHFLSRMPGDERNLAVHFRWQTHGAIDKTNCHPYVVVPGKCALMHNGVLRTGNEKDRTKSDTWHFIRDYLATVELAPSMVHDTGFKALVKDFIGTSNRFVFMTEDGTVSVINAKEGIEHEGLWFSNTYAWRPHLLISGYRGYTSGYQGYQGGSYQGGSYFRGGSYGSHHGNGGHVDADSGFGEDGYGGYYTRAQGSGYTAGSPSASPASANASRQSSAHTGGVTRESRFDHRQQEDAQEQEAWKKVVGTTQRSWPGTSTSSSPTAQGAGTGAAGRNDQDPPEEGAQGRAQGTATGQVISLGTPTSETLAEALLNADVDAFNAWLEKFPTTTIFMLFTAYVPAPTKWCKPEELDGYSRFIYDGILNEDKQLLIAECERTDGSSASVAEVICFYLNWLTGHEAQALREKRKHTYRQQTTIGGVTVASTAADEGSSVRMSDAKHGTHPFPTSPAPAESSIEPSEDHHVEMPHEVSGAVSESRMSQGGERDDDQGFAYRELYLG